MRADDVRGNVNAVAEPPCKFESMVYLDGRIFGSAHPHAGSRIAVTGGGDAASKLRLTLPGSIEDIEGYPVTVPGPRSNARERARHDPDVAFAEIARIREWLGPVLAEVVADAARSVDPIRLEMAAAITSGRLTM